MLSSLSLEISVADITHILKILYQFIGPTYSLIVQFEPSIDWCHGGRQKKTCTWNGGLPTYHPLLTTTRIIGWLYIYIYLFTCCTCTYFRTYIYIHNIHIYIYIYVIIIVVVAVVVVAAAAIIITIIINIIIIMRYF